jgi:hypothetical protein
LRAHLVAVHVVLAEHARHVAVVAPQHGQQQVLGADEFLVEAARLRLRLVQDFSRAVRELGLHAGSHCLIVSEYRRVGVSV